MEIRIDNTSEFIDARLTIIGKTYECEQGNILLRCRLRSTPADLLYFVNLETGECFTVNGNRGLRPIKCHVAKD